MTWVTNAMARVNGIFLKELGVMFELIADNERLFCLKGDASCEHLAAGQAIWEQVEDFMESRGISSTDYDIGHSLTTAFGGLTVRPALCQEWKFMATSGYGTKEPDDAFYMLLTHEFAHQLYAPHTCEFVQTKIVFGLCITYLNLFGFLLQFVIAGEHTTSTWRQTVL